jgi:hypothetical protein
MMHHPEDKQLLETLCGMLSAEKLQQRRFCDCTVTCCQCGRHNCRSTMQGIDLKSYNRWIDIILDIPQLSTKTVKLLGIKFTVPVVRSYKRYALNIPTPNQHVPVVAAKFYFK